MATLGTKFGKGVRRTGSIAAVFAFMLALQGTGWAEDVEATLGSATPPVSNTWAEDGGNALGTVINDPTSGINKKLVDDYSSDPGVAEVNIDISADQVNDGTASNAAAWNLHGSTAPTATGAADGTHIGFKSVSIQGTQSGRVTLSSTDQSPLMRIQNVTGTIAVGKINFNGGTIANTTTDSYAGGGLRLNRFNTTPATPTQINLTDVGFNLNEVNSTAGGGAFGGGIAVTGGSTDYHTLGLDTFDLIGNKVNSSGAAGTHSAQGGGGYFANTSGALVTGGTIRNNEANVENGSHAHGGGMFFTTGGIQAININGTTSFEGNTASVLNRGTQDSFARGGGLMVYGWADNAMTVLTIGGAVGDQVNFTGNHAVASGSAGAGMIVATGGAVHLRHNVDATFTGTVFTQNTAGALTGNAWGGAIGTDYDSAAGPGNEEYNNTLMKLDNVFFDRNSATGKAEAFGGAIYKQVGEIAATNNTSFAGNSATAEGAALGGAVYTRGTNNSFDSVEFSGNTAENTASGYAEGGAIFLNAGELELNNASVSGNKAVATVAGNAANAKGGAIFVNTSRFGAEGIGESSINNALLTLKADANKETVISGNTAGDGLSNGVYFGASGASSGTNNVNGKLSVAGAGTVRLLDGVVAEMGGMDFSLEKEDAGTWVWGGQNVLSGKNVSLGYNTNAATGTTKFTNDFTTAIHSTTANTVALDGVVRWDKNRQSDLALFDFTGAQNKALGHGTNLNIDVDIDRNKLLFGFSGSYLLAEDVTAITGWDVTDPGITTQYITSFDNGTGNQLRANVEAPSQYTWSILNANANGHEALGAIGQLMDQDWVSSADARVMGYNINDTAPGIYENMVHVGFGGIESAANAAKTHGLAGWGGERTPALHASAGSRQAYASLPDGALPHTGFRFWVGYLGDFDRQDSHGGYFGYKANRHGFVAGLNYDLGETASVGIFGGYSHTKTKAKGTRSEVKSDAGHFGLIAGVAPIRALPNLGVSFDFGYTFTDNDAWREIAGNRASGSFDQDLFTLGLEVAYKFNLLNCLNVTPYASMRWSHIKQDGINEGGFAAANIRKVSDDAFNTKLGASVGYDFRFLGGLVTPTLNVAWRHDYGSRQFKSNATYQGVANPIVFRQRSVKGDKNSMDLGANIRAVKQLAGSKQLGLNLGYNLNLGRHHDDHSIYAGIDFAF